MTMARKQREEWQRQAITDSIDKRLLHIRNSKVSRIRKWKGWKETEAKEK